MTRRLRTALAGALGMLVLASPAVAQKLPPAVQEVYRDFARDGVISPCKHTVDDLRETRRDIPPDIDQYAPDFPDAVRGALEAHARGDCAGDGAAADTGGGAPAPAATGGGTPASSAPPAPGEPAKTVASEPPGPPAAASGADTDTGTPAAAPEVARVAAAASSASAPAPVWVAGGGAALLGLALLGTLVAGRTRRGEAGLEQLRHAWGEWTWRASATWSDFADWVRTGR